MSVSWQNQNVPIAVNPASIKLYQHRARNNHGSKGRGTTWLTVTTVATFTGFSRSMYLVAADPTSSSRVENNFGATPSSPKSLRGGRSPTRQSAAGVPSVSEGSQDRFVGLCLLAITGVAARNGLLAMTSKLYRGRIAKRALYSRRSVSCRSSSTLFQFDSRAAIAAISSLILRPWSADNPIMRRRCTMSVRFTENS